MRVSARVRERVRERVRDGSPRYICRFTAAGEVRLGKLGSV